MLEFDKAFNRLLHLEGIYSKNPIDRGGETFNGISRVHHPDWPGWASVDGWLQRGHRPETLAENKFLMGLVRTFYKSTFWESLLCDDLPASIASELFDSAVNCGQGTAARWLQKSVNLFAATDILKVDGVIGEKTLTKLLVQVENFGQGHILVAMNGFQFMHYLKIVEGDKTQKAFIRGWLMNRVAFGGVA